MKKIFSGLVLGSFALALGCAGGKGGGPSGGSGGNSAEAPFIPDPVELSFAPSQTLPQDEYTAFLQFVAAVLNDEKTPDFVSAEDIVQNAFPEHAESSTSRDKRFKLAATFNKKDLAHVEVMKTRCTAINNKRSVNQRLENDQQVGSEDFIYEIAGENCPLSLKITASDSRRIEKFDYQAKQFRYVEYGNRTNELNINNTQIFEPYKPRFNNNPPVPIANQKLSGVSTVYSYRTEYLDKVHVALGYLDSITNLSLTDTNNKTFQFNAKVNGWVHLKDKEAFAQIHYKFTITQGYSQPVGFSFVTTTPMNPEKDIGFNELPLAPATKYITRLVLNGREIPRPELEELKKTNFKSLIPTSQSEPTKDEKKTEQSKKQQGKQQQGQKR